MEKNPWIGKNYIATTSAEVPPPYFLQRVWDQDAMLVIMPSIKTPFAYVVARRKQFGPGLTDAAVDAQFANPDTRQCVKNGCVPVCLMMKTGPTWNVDGLIQSLQARDLWAHGGADKVADQMEADEDAAKKATQKAIRDDLYNRSGDAWRSYQSRTGASSIQHHAMHPSKPQPGPADDKSAPSRSTVGSGSVNSD